MEKVYPLLITGLGTICGFLALRILTQYDKFKEETKKNFIEIRRAGEANYRDIKSDIRTIKNVTIDQKARTKIQLLEQSMKENKINFEGISKKQEVDHGSILWLKEEKIKTDKVTKDFYNGMKKKFNIKG